MAKANIFEIPFPGENRSDEFLVCVAPHRTMHLWRVSDDGRPLPTFAFGDSARSSKLRHVWQTVNVSPGCEDKSWKVEADLMQTFGTA